MIDQRYLTIHQEYKISFRDLILLILVYEEQHGFLRIAYEDNFIDFNFSVRFLEEKGLIKWHGNNPEEITLRKTGEELFKKHVGTKKKITTSKEVTQWIESWREIFPEGVNTAGFRYRGDKAEVTQKMIKFVNTQDYTLEQIFKATRDYVERFSLRGYAYMQQAHYFIQKRGVGSTLSAECEGLAEKSSNTKGEEKDYGRSVV